MADPKIVGTWAVKNHVKNMTGQVTFNTDNTYTIDSGNYTAGGSWVGVTSGTYKLLPGGAILLSATTPTNLNQLVLVRCATTNRIIHSSHTDYEELNRLRP